MGMQISSLPCLRHGEREGGGNPRWRSIENRSQVIKRDRPKQKYEGDTFWNSPEGTGSISMLCSCPGCF